MYPPPYQHPQYVVVSAVPRTSGAAVTSMILGILAILFCWIPFFGVVAWPLLIVSIVLGCVALPATRSGGQTGHGMAIAGLVCSGLALIVCALYVVFFFAVAGAMP